MRHVTVFSQPGVFAGWPANHGAWQWGDELLFGFIRGRHFVGGMHNVCGPLEKVLARSLDGGETWAIETPRVDFDAKSTTTAPAFDLAENILRVCGDYDHGGEDCARGGGFYLSSDRGHNWRGAFSFDGLGLGGTHTMTSRTCVLGDLVFLSSAGTGHWGGDFTFCARYKDGVFVPHSMLLDDESRAVMPAADRVGDRIIVAMRRRGTRRIGGWVDAIWSDDEGKTWSDPVHVMDTGMENGNPPAIIARDGLVYCAYGNRSNCGIHVAVTGDRGETWVHYKTLRDGKASDIGYPRLFKRSDGKLVCVYYWTDAYEQPQRIEATIFE